MTLFDEVQQLSSESYAKWFERYFKKHNLEQKIKVSAQQGYTSLLMDVLSVKDEYTRRRLDDEKTLELLREMLGPGFRVRYKIYHSRNIFTGDTYTSDKKIHISWEQED